MSELEFQHYPIDVDVIPKSWCVSSIADLHAEVQSGFPTGEHNKEGLGIPHIRPMNIDRNGVIDLADIKYVSPATSALRVQQSDVLFNNTNSPELIGKTAAIMHCDVWAFSNHMTRLRFTEDVDYRFAAHQLHYLWMARYFRHRCVNHVNQASISAKPLAQSVPFLLAPLGEQRRIVAKIDELFSDLDAGVVALKRAKANLKRYRAAVLKAAVEGKLTEEWRAKHPAKESASILLARILKERRQKWEADQLAKFAAAQKEPPKNWREKYVEPTARVTTGLPELPADWCWASVQQVGSVQLGRQRAPQHHSGQHMRPYLRVANVFEDRIDISDVMEMNFTPVEFETYQLGYGDILLNEGQSMELVGRPAIYRDEVPGACFTNTLVRFRVYDGVDTDYALRVFLAYLKNGRFQKIATITVNIAHLGASRFSEIEFPLAPIEEQAAIIEEVDRHFSLIDAAEKAITFSLVRAVRLRQSILKQAFEGKLVPQDPNDEPASVLLERARAKQASHERNGKADNPARTRGRRAKSKMTEGRAGE